MDDPKHIGRYEILGELGKGAMGKVYRAQDPNIGRIVALKTMRLDVHGSDDVEILRRFKHEAKLAGVLNHGNIVTIYDAGEFEGVFYMAMEYLEGSTLQTLLHNHRTLPPDRMVEISRQVCAGLDYAHSHNVIHRDIKPANIMMTGDNVAKIMDFGIAKSSANMTTTGQVLGTPTYMSPEQVRGKQLDGRSDIFSFGVVLYEMVVGEKPFTGQTITTIIYKIIHEAAIPPRELDVTVHPGISTVIMKALAKNPAERYQTGADLVRDLLNYKSMGSDTESTKMIAAVTPAGGASVVAPAAAAPNAPPPPAQKLGSAAAGILGKAKALAARPVKAVAAKAAAASLKPSAKAPVDSTVGVRIGNKPSALPPPPGQKNLRTAGIIGGALLGVVVLAGAWQWSQSDGATPSDASATANPTATDPGAAGTGDTSGAPAPGKTEKPSPLGPPATASGKAAAKTGAAKTALVPTATAPTTSAPKATGSSTPAPPIPADKGNLQVNSEPAGAKVVVTGPTSAHGTTPFTATSLEPGNYSITLTKAGFAPLTRTVRVIGGRGAAVGVDLKPEGVAPGTLVIASTPSGGEIFLDGKSTGKVTPQQMQVPSGDHKIEIKKGGYRDAETTASVKAGARHTFAPTLEVAKSGGGNPFRGIRGLFGGNKIPEGKGMVNFKTNPSGADIIHNGVKVEKQTPAKFPMDPGSYKVTIRKEGYKARLHEFTVVKGKSVDVDVTLEKN
ncbi:MAG: protein kinase [Terriglobales bacterium]